MSAGNAAVASHKRRVNVAIRAGISNAGDTVAFVCECGTPGCFGVIWLQAGEYDSEGDDPRWSVLASGHRPATMREAA
jgi:hypothetical protein